MNKFNRLNDVNDSAYNKAKMRMCDKGEEAKQYEKKMHHALKEQQMLATPLRWDGNIVRPLRQSFLMPSMYKNVAVVYIEDSGAVLYFLESDFACILMYKTLEDVFEFIDTVKGNINYDEDDDNGNINAVINAWYDRGVLTW